MRSLLKSGIVFLLLAGLIQPPHASAREFLCTVGVNYRQLEGSGFDFLNDLSELIRDYINENSWTNDRFAPEERIECSIQIFFLDAFTQTTFRAQLVITSKRPIYGTMAKTTILQVSDDRWEFAFAQGTPLVFETERYNALTSVIDYYMYVILGYDYDTFDELGGEEHFQKARRIMQAAIVANGAGWDGLDRDSRTQLVDQMTDPRFRPFREAYFNYHFYGLDHFTEEVDEARQAMIEVLLTMRDLYNDLSRQYVFDIFFLNKVSGAGLGF